MRIIQSIRGLMRRNETLPVEKTAELLMPTIQTTTPLGSFSIISHIFESDLDKKYGLVLGDLRNGRDNGLSERVASMTYFTGGFYHPPEGIKKRILKRYKEVPDFCSMALESEEELIAHTRKIHEVSYSHYVWAKENNLQGRFPDLCCGSSSRNLFLNLMDVGYPNSTCVYNDHKDHAYVALPFIMGKEKPQGFIVVDPTSDQLFYDKQIAPRNNLFVVFGDRWQYRTDWKGGCDLYPSVEDNSSYGNLGTLRTNTSSHINLINGIDEYFDQVFRNPVKVDVDLS